MKVLILCLPAIGDALMATPMVALLKKKHPQMQIDIACMFDGVGYVYKNNKNVNKVYKLSLYKKNPVQGFLQLLELRENHYDVSLLIFPSYRREYHFVQWVIGAKKRIAHSFNKGFYTELNFLDTHHYLVDESEHNVINNLNLLKSFGIEWKKELKKESIRYTFILDESDVLFGKEFMQKLGWQKENSIGIHPGSTISPAALLRRWPIENYAAVINYLIKIKKKKVMIFVGPDEADAGKRLQELVTDEKNCILINNVPFHQAMGLLQQMKLLICNDNGFGHLANALGVPIITLWASTNDKWSLPYNRELVTLIRPQNMIPWYRYDMKRSINKNAVGGMDKISVKAVIEAINTQFG